MADGKVDAKNLTGLEALLGGMQTRMEHVQELEAGVRREIDALQTEATDVAFSTHGMMMPTSPVDPLSAQHEVERIITENHMKSANSPGFSDFRASSGINPSVKTIVLPLNSEFQPYTS